MMEQSPGFPTNTNLKGIMEFYFQCCALEVTAKKLSYAAATLANGGINPLTGERIFSHDTVKHCLSIMFMCGMYDYSGEFAFKVGIPSKSGVSGAIVSIIPNVMGVCTFSPPLDKYGNSFRGGVFLAKLSEQFTFHHFDNLNPSELSQKLDPRKSLILNQTSFQHSRKPSISENLTESYCKSDGLQSPSELFRSNSVSKYNTFKIIQYAAAGDLQALKRMDFNGLDLSVVDYDFRTPLHLAASCGHLGIVKYLVESTSYHQIDINSLKDRWNGSPLDDAKREGHQNIIEYLQSINTFSNTDRQSDDRQ